MLISTARIMRNPLLKCFSHCLMTNIFLPILDRVNGITTVGRPSAQIYGFIITLVKLHSIIIDTITLKNIKRAKISLFRLIILSQNLTSEVEGTTKQDPCIRIFLDYRLNCVVDGLGSHGMHPRGTCFADRFFS